MAINRTPVLKRCRQLGIDPIVLGYTKESKKQPKQRRRQESEYGRQLREKQKAKFIYGVLEKQFRGYFHKARQTVTHGHITVNGKRVDIPSYRVSAGDLVAIAPAAKDLLVIKSALISNERVQVPAWLEVDIEKLQGNVISLPTRDQIDLDIQEQLIVELYSK